MGNSTSTADAAAAPTLAATKETMIPQVASTEAVASCVSTTPSPPSSSLVAGATPTPVASEERKDGLEEKTPAPAPLAFLAELYAKTYAKTSQVPQAADETKAAGAPALAVAHETKREVATALVPYLTSIDEVLTTKGEALIEYAATRPNDDLIVVLEPTGVIRGTLVVGGLRGGLASCVAGSAAVRELQTRLAERARQLGLDEATVFRSAAVRERAAWRPADVDVFVLGQPTAARFKLLQTDMVHVPDRCVADLLLGFDLPCCRAAIDATGDLWCSLHCLAALLSGQYVLPKLLATADGCVELIRRAHEQYQAPYEHVGVRRSDEDKARDAQFVHKRTLERTAKYSLERGIVPRFVDEALVPRWIFLRFVRRFQAYVAEDS